MYGLRQNELETLNFKCTDRDCHYTFSGQYYYYVGVLGISHIQFPCFPSSYNHNNSTYPDMFCYLNYQPLLYVGLVWEYCQHLNTSQDA